MLPSEYSIAVAYLNMASLVTYTRHTQDPSNKNSTMVLGGALEDPPLSKKVESIFFKNVATGTFHMPQSDSIPTGI